MKKIKYNKIAYSIVYNRQGQKSKCLYETTEQALFNKYLEELKNDNTVSNIKVKKAS